MWSKVASEQIFEAAENITQVVFMNAVTLTLIRAIKTTKSFSGRGNGKEGPRSTWWKSNLFSNEKRLRVIC